MTPAFLLLVPAPGDPGGLLAPDDPGIHPRMALRRVESSFGSALALWWDGDLSPGGWDRALRAHNAWRPLGPKWWAFIEAWKGDAWRRPRINLVLALSASLVEDGIASRVMEDRP